MPEPISEQIAQKVVERMESVTVANGYELTFSSVERYDANRGTKAAPLKAVVLEFDDEPEDPPQGYFQYLKQMGVQVFVMESESSDTTPDQRVNQIRAAVETAVMTDPFWSDLAVNTFLRGLQRFDPTEDVYGCIVFFDIQYRVLEADPYAQ